jgi:hypothetical protein
MNKSLSVIIASAFAAASFGVAAQTKDVTTKSGDAAKTKGGQAVTTKDMKDKPKPAPKAAAAPAPEKPAKAKTPGSPVMTKDGKQVTGKDQKGVATKAK